MATVVIYGGSDGHVISSSGANYVPTYSDVRAGVNLVATADSLQVGQYGESEYSGPGQWHRCSEAFISFDTSTVTNPTAVVMSLYATHGTMDNAPFTTEARLHDWGTTVTTADWVPGADLGTKPLLASWLRPAPGAGPPDYAPNFYYAFTENGTALRDNLNLTGTTRILLNSNFHRLGEPPWDGIYGVNGVYEQMYFTSAAAAGTTTDPKLVIHQGVGTQRLAPDALTTQTNLTGTLANIQDDPDAPDGNWLTATSNNSTVTAHVTFPTPTGGLLAGAGLQEFRVLLRRGLFAAQPSGATVTISLYENGVLVSSGTPTVLTVPAGEVLSYTWDGAGRNAALIECRVVAVAYQSGPDKGSADIGAIEWIAAAAIQPTSIPSAASVPSPIVQFPPQTITIASGIPTAQSVPAPTLRPVISPTSIPTAQSVPSPTIVGGAYLQTISPTSITTAVSVPSPQLNLKIFPTSIPTAQSVPSPSVNQRITIANGIPTAASVPAPKVNFVIQPTSIPSREFVPPPRIGPSITLTYWELKVFNRDGALVAYIPRWNGLQFQKLLNAEGTGSVTLELDDDAFLNIGTNDLLNNEFIWEVWWNGKRVFGFSNEDIAQVHVAADGTRTATMSGRGLGKYLETGIVLPPGFPTNWPNVIPEWELVGVPAMAAWLQLLAAAQARGAIASPALTPTFSATTDSGSGTWTDLHDLVIAPGEDLLSTLTKMVELARGPIQPDLTYATADWIVQPDRTIEVRAPFGNHYEHLVRFQVGYDQVEFSRDRTRRDIRNAMYVESADKDIADDVRSLSQATWGRRELYVKATDAPDFEAGLIYASRALDQVADEKVQITITVLPDHDGRVVFFDYDAGDWVGVDSDDARVTGDYRIVSISVGVDDSAGTVLQLGMQSLMQYQLDRLSRAISAGGGAGSLSAVATGIGNSTPTPAQTVQAATRGPIVVTPTGLTLSTGANLNVVYIDAGWTGPAVGFTNPDPISEYEVEVIRTLPLPAATTYRVIRVKAGTPIAGSPDAAIVRIEPVEPNSTYQVRVRAISRLGQVSGLAGPATIATLADTTAPVAAPAGLVGGAGLRSITITWNEVADADVANGNGTYDVQIDTNTLFNNIGPPAGNLRGKRTSGTIISFTDLPLTGQTWYSRVRAIDSGGVAGPWTAASAPITTVATTATDIGPNSITTGSISTGQINSDHIITAGLDAAVVKFGTMDGDRITVNTLSAQAIEASNLSVAVDLAVGGVLQTDFAFSPTDHRYIIMDGGGLRFYTGGSAAYTGGVPTMFLDTATGLGTFNNVTVNGTINAVGGTFSGNITSSATITGGTVQTSANPSLARVALDTAGLRAFPAGGVSEVQQVTITGTPTGGTFTLTYAGQTTTAIAYNASTATVQAALVALSTIGTGNVVVAGGPLPGTFITVTFAGALSSTDVAQMTAAGSFTGGATPTVTVTTTTAGVATLPTLDFKTSDGSLTLNQSLTMATGGRIRSSATGRRLEISTTTGTALNFYTGNAAETGPGVIDSLFEFGIEKLRLRSPNLGFGQSQILMIPGSNGGFIGITGRTTITGATGGSGGFQAAISLNQSPWVAGQYTLYVGIGNVEFAGTSSGNDALFRIGGGRIEIGRNTGNTAAACRIGPSIAHGAEYCEVTNAAHDGNGSYALLQSSAGDTFVNAASGATLFLRVANSTKVSVTASGMNVTGTTNLGTLNAATTDVWGLTADAITCWSVNSSGSIAVNDSDFRLRGITDAAHRIWFNSGIDGVEVYGNSRVRLASNGMAQFDAGGAGIYMYTVPGGSDVDTILRIAGSWQVLKHTSSIKAKRDVEDMPRRRDDNPVWAMRPVTFKWKNRPPEELERLDRLRPGGRSVGFIAEEMHELSPDAVTFDADDEPDGVNESGVLAYIVAGLQYLRERIEAIEAVTNEGNEA